MKKLPVVLGLVVALDSGAAWAASERETCARYGFQPGTAEFAGCVERETVRRDAENRRGWDAFINDDWLKREEEARERHNRTLRQMYCTSAQLSGRSCTP